MDFRQDRLAASLLPHNYAEINNAIGDNRL